MPLELIEDAGGDIKNAQFMAMASELAYLPSDLGQTAFKEQLGLDVLLLSVGSTQVYIGTSPEHIVAAFRGTEAPTSIEGLRDWLLTDAVNLLILPEGRLGTDLVAAGVGARFHMGFVNALSDIWDPLKETLTKYRSEKKRPLWLTGHSLGGALALLSAWMCDRHFLPVHQVYTYGAPMVGNKLASDAIDRAFPEMIYRYVNIDDPVPRLPTVSLAANDYTHCQREMTLGTIAEGAGALALFQGMASRTADGILNATLLNDLWEGVRARVAAHGLDVYRKLIG